MWSLTVWKLEDFFLIVKSGFVSKGALLKSCQKMYITDLDGNNDLEIAIKVTETVIINHISDD